MMTGPILCLACTRYAGDGTCTSFPGGIPEDIIRFGADHRTSIAGEPPFELDPARIEAFDNWQKFAPKE
jgi:hypothetical protein